MKQISRLLLACMVSAGLGAEVFAENDSADVIVYHASPGGISTAIAAAREGLSVQIITPNYRLGGIEANGGLVNSDQGPHPKETIGGLRLEFHQRIDRYYRETYGADSRQVMRATKGDFPAGRFEPKVAEMVYHRMLAEYPSIRPVVYGQELVSVEKKDGRIVSIVCEDLDHPGETVSYPGRIFVDASYTGDLLAGAGVSYYLGREPRSMYDESKAGIRSGANVGAADRAVQSYNYRMTTTRVATNRVPVVKPADYEKNRADYYATSKRNFERVRAGERKFWHPEWAELPNLKFDTNIGDMMEFAHGYSEADRAGRREIERVQRNYSIGYLWFLQHDPLTPEATREQFAGLGFAKDEFPENDSFPVELYVREGRRMIGEHVLVQQDLTTNIRKPDSICIGSYFMDCHACAWIRTEDGSLALDEDGNPQREGYVGGDIDPYEIPYRSLVPKKNECTNLLVPVCISATHVAWTSVRMEPIFAMMGEAAGVASALALESRLPVQDVNPAVLRKKLEACGAIVDLPEASAGSAAMSWSPQTVTAGSAVTFSVKDLTGQVEALWDFDGDGKADASGSQVSTVFDGAKNPLVTLCVRSPAGDVLALMEQMVPVKGAVASDVSVDSESSSGIETRGGLAQTAKEGRGGPVYGENFLNDMGKNKGGVSVRYNLPLSAPGRYAVYISTDPAKGRPDNTLVRINTVGGESEVRVDQRTADNPCGLVFAGEFALPQADAWVEIRNDGTERYCIFDAVRAIYLGE